MKKYFLIFVFASTIFLSHYMFSGQAVYGDGIEYWMYLPSLYFDHDVDFENNFRHIYSHENNNSKSPQLSPDTLKKGLIVPERTDNPHPIGTAIVWFPAFFLADLTSLVFKLPRNGYTDTYQIFAGLWSVVVLTFGLYINERIAFKITKSRLAGLSVAGIFLATPLLYYGSYDILNSHFASFTLVSLFWFLLFKKKHNNKDFLTLGLLIGLASVVRLQEILLLIPASIYLISEKRNGILPSYLYLLIAFSIILTPMLFVWNYLYGKPIPLTYTANWTKNNTVNLGSWFDLQKGLLRTPLMFLALIGIPDFFKKDRKIFWLMASYFLMQSIIIITQGGWNAAAYGGRMYISTLPLFTVLLTYLLQKISGRRNFKLAVLFIAILSVLNIANIVNFVLFQKDVNSGTGKGLEKNTRQKIEAIFEKYSPGRILKY